MGSDSTPADTPSVVVAVAVHHLDHAYAHLPNALERWEMVGQVQRWVDTTAPTAGRAICPRTHEGDQSRTPGLGTTGTREMAVAEVDDA